MGFLTKTSRAVGTTPVEVGSGATPGSGKTWVVIGLTLCNILNEPVNVTAKLVDVATNETHILKNFPLPIGETVVPQGALGKVALQPTEKIVVEASVNSSVDVILSVLETP